MLCRHLNRYHRIGEHFCVNYIKLYSKNINSALFKLLLFQPLVLESLATSAHDSMTKSRRLAGNANARTGVTNVAGSRPVRSRSCVQLLPCFRLVHRGEMAASHR